VNRFGAASLIGVGAVAIVACGGSNDDAIVEVDGIAVTDAWARPTPPTVDEAAFYLTVENRGAPEDRLIDAESPACTVLTLHVTEIDANDVARMAEADRDQLGLRKGRTVEMSPNGLHLMCLGLTAPLEEGDEVEVVLRFAEHDPITVPLTVEQR
jgi:copper(I)-binding protein